MNRSIYLLSPRHLSPETIAVAFAKTSRSPESFREIAAELNDAESAKFHEKWVVGYGHASVAEHAVLHIAFENVSRLAIECIESNRLASYTEKSTRYQKWNPNSFYTPACIADSPHNDLYHHACAKLFETYQKSLAPLKAWVESRHPRHDGESEAKYDGRIRSKYVDNCRYLLPASSLANVGMTANARVIENAIRKMLSHPLQEVREIGEEVKKVALGETPTLVKYADRVPYLADVQNRQAQIPNSKTQTSGSWVMLNEYDRDGEEKFLAAFLYRFGGMSFEEALNVVKGMNDEQRIALAHDALGGLDKYDAPIRELEHITYTFDVVMDQGAYFELKRHRMMTQTPQRLTADLGWATPSAFEFANFQNEYESAMQIAAEAYHALAADFPEEASYVVPNGFNRRVLMTLNLRQAFALCELRTTPGAHFAVRRITAKMYELIHDVHPLLAKFMRCGERPKAEEIEKDFFVNKI
jgi:thymidylate synthase ThyX